MDDAAFSLLKDQVRKLTRIDLDAYKSQQMRRRLDGFVSRRTSNVAEFCRHLESNSELLKDLENFLMINVSEFFRDPKSFDYLQQKVLPDLLRRSHRLNIWSMACSGGQEPYSLYILLAEASTGRRHRILATDIDDRALQLARNGGPHSEQNLKGVSENRLERFFTRKLDGYYVTDVARNAIEFRKHNLLSSPVEEGFDLIVCRNVVIYFRDEVKEELYRQIRRCLKPEGVLFTGGTEVIMRAGSHGFKSLHPSFYQKCDQVEDNVDWQFVRRLPE